MAKIALDDVCVSFDVRRHGRLSLKEFVVRGMFRRKVNPRITVQALDAVTFELNEGDRLGIVGHNGAGKSTLLRTIAGVYPPSRGVCHVQGKISSLFDVTAGFEGDASGWENITHRGYLQGETPKSIASRVQAIADYSELGQYLDMSVRYYSMGMVVRLGFAIATAVEPEILLVDEILSAGDQAFQKKARERIEAMIQQARLVVLASHDTSALQSLCNRMVWMDHGRVRMFGDTDEVLNKYLNTPQPTLRKAA